MVKVYDSVRLTTDQPSQKGFLWTKTYVPVVCVCVWRSCRRCLISGAFFSHSLTHSISCSPSLCLVLSALWMMLDVAILDIPATI